MGSPFLPSRVGCILSGEGQVWNYYLYPRYSGLDLVSVPSPQSLVCPAYCFLVFVHTLTLFHIFLDLAFFP